MANRQLEAHPTGPAADASPSAGTARLDHPIGQDAVPGAVLDGPSVDVRVVAFTVAGGALQVALDGGPDAARIPRGKPSPAEPLDAAARRIARAALGLQEQYLEQLYTLSLPEPPRWTVIVGYLALVSSGRGGAPPGDGAWSDTADLPALAPADRMVADYALTRLRAKLGYTNIAFHLLPETFTLTELQHAYETILAGRLDKRNFRRRVIASGILVQTPDKRRDGSHRPAALYRFRPGDDRETYLPPPWAAGA